MDGAATRAMRHERGKNPSILYESIEKFRQFVELRDLRPRTREAYVLYPVLLGRHAKADPAGLAEEPLGGLGALSLSKRQVRDFCLCLRNERHYAGSSLGLARASLRAFQELRRAALASILSSRSV